MTTLLLWILTSALLLTMIIKKFNNKPFMILFIGETLLTLTYIIHNITEIHNLNTCIPYIPIVIMGILMILKLFFAIKLKFRMRAIRKAVRLRQKNKK